MEIIEKINSNTFRLKLPSHIRTANVFNVKHLVPFHGDSSSEDADFPNSWPNSSQHGEDDADQVAILIFKTPKTTKRLDIAGS